jgi:hypothetical protein
MLDKKNKAKYQNPELKKFGVFLLSLLNHREVAQ